MSASGLAQAGEAISKIPATKGKYMRLCPMSGADPYDVHNNKTKTVWPLASVMVLLSYE